MPLTEDTRLTVIAKTLGLPPHEWTFPNQSLTLPSPPWYLYTVLLTLILILMGLIYYWRVFRHPLVVAVSPSPAQLYDLPLEELPQARRWLQWAGRWQTVLNQQQIPLNQWETTLQFYQAARAELLAKLLDVSHSIETSGTPDLPLYYLQGFGESLVLPIDKCLLILPPPTWQTSQVVAKLRYLPSSQQTPVCLIISTDLTQQTQLQKAPQEEGQGSLMRVVPNNSALPRLFLVPPPTPAKPLHN